MPGQTKNLLWQSQAFCARRKDELHSVKSFFVPALNAVKFLGWLKEFGSAQNILGQGISRIGTIIPRFKC